MKFAEKVRAHEQKRTAIGDEQRAILREAGSLAFDARKLEENAGYDDDRGFPDFTSIAVRARKLAERIDSHEVIVREFSAESVAEVSA